MIDQPAWGSPDSEAAVTSRCRDASNDSTNRDKVCPAWCRMALTRKRTMKKLLTLALGISLLGGLTPALLRAADADSGNKKRPKATEEQIQQAMSGVLCRCFAHTRMLRAIKRYADGSAL